MTKPKTKESQLTDKERVFVENYLLTFNGAKAARLAGYSEKSARDIAYQMLHKPHIAARISQRMEDVAMSASEVLWRLAALARSDEPHKALELLGKYHKLFTDKTEVTGGNGGALEIVIREVSPDSYAND